MAKPAKGKARVKVTSTGKRVSFGQAGRASGGGPRVRPGLLCAVSRSNEKTPCCCQEPKQSFETFTQTLEVFWHNFKEIVWLNVPDFTQTFTPKESVLHELEKAA